MKQYLSIYCIVLVLVTGCKPPAREEDPLPDLQAKGIYIVNEGNFQWGNGSVSYYNIDSEVLTKDIFSKQNNEIAGDVCQSLSFYQKQFYLVVNNSNKVEILDSNFVRTATVDGLNSPRYIAFAPNTKAYISDLYANGVSVLNTATKVIEKKIPIPYWTEELVSYKDTIYVSSPSSKYLYLINAANDKLIDSIQIGYGSSSLAIDAHNHLWIATSGNKKSTIKASLLMMDLHSRTILLKKEFAEADAYPGRLNYNPIDKHVYWLDNGLNRFDTENIAGNTETFVAANGRVLYGLTINPYNGDLVVSDAGDFVQRSVVYIYSKDGIQKTSFAAGIISGFMLVK